MNMQIKYNKSIQVNDTTIILEGNRVNLFVNTIIKIENPRIKTLVADESVLGIYTQPSSKKNFRAVILNIINFFTAKEQMPKEVESDLRKLVNQNMYKEVIGSAITEFKNNFITTYENLEHITINRKNVILSIPNNLGVKIKLIFLFTSKYHYGFHLIISDESKSFSLARWHKLLNTNSIIKQIIDWEKQALLNNNNELFFQAKLCLKGYLISNKAEINALLLDINSYTKKTIS